MTEANPTFERLLISDGKVIFRSEHDTFESAHNWPSHVKADFFKGRLEQRKRYRFTSIVVGNINGEQWHIETSIMWVECNRKITPHGVNITWKIQNNRQYKIEKEQ